MKYNDHINQQQVTKLAIKLAQRKGITIFCRGNEILDTSDREMFEACMDKATVIIRRNNEKKRLH